MSRPVDMDAVMVLASQIAIASPERRGILLAELECMLAQATPGADVDALRLELARMTGAGR